MPKLFPEYSQSIPNVFLKYSQRFPKVHSKYSQGIPKVFPNYSKSILRVFPMYSVCIPKVCIPPISTKNTKKAKNNNIKETLKKHSENKIQTPLIWVLLKVSKSQKQFFLKLHCPKNERNI